MWAYVPCVADADNTKCRRGGERSECVPDGLEIFLNPSNLTSSSAVTSPPGTQELHLHPLCLEAAIVSLPPPCPTNSFVLHEAIASSYVRHIAWSLSCVSSAPVTLELSVS